MRLLFEMDKKDYGECTQTFARDSARSIIIRDGRIAMIHSQKYDYYKFPGGGIENGENPVEAMIRETQEILPNASFRTITTISATLWTAWYLKTSMITRRRNLTDWST